MEQAAPALQLLPVEVASRTSEKYVEAYHPLTGRDLMCNGIAGQSGAA